MKIKKATKTAKAVKTVVKKAVVATKKAPVAAKPVAEKKAVPAKKAPAKKAVAKKADTKKTVTFTVRAESGKKVFLAGSFNNWDATAKQMTEKKGVYTAALKLEAGTYQYKFVIDGTWAADPENADWVQNDCGTLNSVITVK